jgi:hypothetical protein
MTREEYDARVQNLLSMCYPKLVRGNPLLANGLPDVAAMMAAAKSRGFGLVPPQFIEGINGRPAPKVHAQTREKARRLRQRAAA